MRILGIDVGFSGGLAVVTDNGVLCDYHPMPVIVSKKPTGRESKKTGKQIIKVTTYLDIPALATLIGDLEPDVAVIEKVSSMPKQGITGAFRFGEQYGIIQGVLCTLQISQRFIRPQEWKGKVLAGYDSKDKGSSLLYVKRRWPTSKIEGTKQQIEGQADAICIALAVEKERDALKGKLEEAEDETIAFNTAYAKARGQTKRVNEPRRIERSLLAGLVEAGYKYGWCHWAWCAANNDLKAQCTCGFYELVTALTAAKEYLEKGEKK